MLHSACLHNGSPSRPIFAKDPLASLPPMSMNDTVVNIEPPLIEGDGGAYEWRPLAPRGVEHRSVNGTARSVMFCNILPFPALQLHPHSDPLAPQPAGRKDVRACARPFVCCLSQDTVDCFLDMYRHYLSYVSWRTPPLFIMSKAPRAKGALLACLCCSSSLFCSMNHDDAIIIYHMHVCSSPGLAWR